MALAHQIKFSEAKQKADKPKASGGSKAAREQRTATPLPDEASVGPTSSEGAAPLSAAKAKRGPVGPKATFLVTVPGPMLKRLEAGRAAGGFRSRNDYVVSLLEAAPK